MTKNQESTARRIAQGLLKVEAVKLRPNDPFTWASGWKSPIYCDNRKALSYPGLRNEIKSAFIKSIEDLRQHVDMIVGVATAGVPWGAMVADYYTIPFAYIRSSAKDHGTKSKIEGVINAGDKVVVIEDLISTGGSSAAVAKAAIEECGAGVVDLQAIFWYQFAQAKEAFANIDCSFSTLCDYTTLIDVALEEKYIGQDDVDMLNKWRISPDTWRNDLK